MNWGGQFPRKISDFFVEVLANIRAEIDGFIAKAVASCTKWFKAFIVDRS